jgi:hypothetical protein
MRNLIIGAVTAVALLGAPAAAGAAVAPRSTPVTDPLGSGSPNGSITLPAGHNCTFAVGIAVVANNELQDVTKLADGSTVIKVSGKLVLNFKNDTTGKTIKEDVSGTTTRIVNADRSGGTFKGEGPNWLAFGPHGQAKTGEPGLVFISGLATVKFAAVKKVLTVQTFSLNGSQQNGCTLLS